MELEPRPRSNPRMAGSIGDADTQSRAKAETAKKRTSEAQGQVEADSDWPQSSQGKPLVKISMTAAELVPTGQYANVSVGPAQITAFVDPDEEDFFDESQRSNLAKSLNALAEIVESDVIAVQRNLVMESIQSSLNDKGK